MRGCLVSGGMSVRTCACSADLCFTTDGSPQCRRDGGERGKNKQNKKSLKISKVKKQKDSWAMSHCWACERSAAFPDNNDVQCLGSCENTICGWGRRGPESGLVFLALWKVTSGVCGFSLGALCFALCSLRLLGAFRGTTDGGGRFRLRVDILGVAVASLQLFVLHTTQLSCGGPGTQRPLLVSLAERVGAELAEGFRVFPTDVTVMPGAVPAACGEPRHFH